jgi:predicted HTH domain antitoxin
LPFVRLTARRDLISFWYIASIAGMDPRGSHQTVTARSAKPENYANEPYSEIAGDRNLGN